MFLQRLLRLVLVPVLFMATLSRVTLQADDDLTDEQLYAVMGIITNFILSDGGGITHNGTTYGSVTSPYTGKVWLDRNLGASQVCTNSTDTACYGDLLSVG